MTDLDLNNWLTYTSLFIALIGGVPGFIAVRRERKTRPQIAAYIHNISVISTKDHVNRERVGLIFDITIGNKGREAIVPLALQLECKVNNKWLKFETGRIPEGFVVTGPQGQRQYTNVIETDLNQRKTAITRESPVHGSLAFLTDEIGHSELNAIFVQMPKKLLCVDLFMERHKIILNQDLTSTLVNADCSSESP